MTGTRFYLEVQPTIPPRLARLGELANDLMYSWDRQIRRLFYRLDRSLWEACHHNPKVFLRRVAQERLEAAAKDRGFMEDYHRALSSYDTYHSEGMRPTLEDHLDPEQDLVAYFCAEFGLHESVPIYSGGLGILAGDHCKAASDLGIPFVGIGLLYRQGYFIQTVDNHGQQIAHYMPIRFDDLPIQPALDPDGNEVRVKIQMPDREVTIKVWRGKAGHITLYLLDTDLTENREDDRTITYQLYGGDRETRIRQEIVLGIGGIRAIRTLGLDPTVWYINEGHAAFQILERCREHVQAGRDFDTALELVASGTVFTTHTPVPAGHDIFQAELLWVYLHDAADALHIDDDRLFRLGAFPGQEDGFNMTALALRGSRFHNGVSRIHGGVASRMESYVWPQVPPEENPISYVTNGVHLHTFLAREWVNLFDMRFSDWRNALCDPEYWECVEQIPDLRFWSLRQELKSSMLEYVRSRITAQHRRNGVSAANISRITEYLSPAKSDTLVLGFARRFATYKRATLLFSDRERLVRLLNDPERPVIVIFAGKAHPSDTPGQELIRTIHEYAMSPEFMGKIILLEGYDIALARKLVTGVDVWVNTPEYPLEASGTSGEKAGINGVINLSVLDGWWGEGYDGTNGWAIAPHGPHFDPEQRNREEASDLLNLVEHEVIPLYYDRDHQGYSPGWVKLSKASMKTLIPRFSAQRMVVDYIRGFYDPARRQSTRLGADQGAPAAELARWKHKIAQHWPGVGLRLVEQPPYEIRHDEVLHVQVAAFLNGLEREDVTVECLIGTEDGEGEFEVSQRLHLSPQHTTDNDEVVFAMEYMPELSGLQQLRIRMYPHHEMLSHPLEMGRMIWL